MTFDLQATMEEFEELARNTLPEIDIAWEINEHRMQHGLVDDKMRNDLAAWQASIADNLAASWCGEILSQQIWDAEQEEQEEKEEGVLALEDGGFEDFIYIGKVEIDLNDLQDILRDVLITGLHWRNKLEKDFADE